jgi:hypothetical protein
MTPGAKAAGWRPARRSDLDELLERIGPRLRRGTPVYLVGATSQLYEGWIAEARVVHLAAAAGNRDALARALLPPPNADGRVSIVLEHPGDILPLPSGHETRARPVPDAPLYLCHFDPYSVSFRLIARGEEDDYGAVLEYLKHGWITAETMNDLLDRLLPRFTSETIQQDPAEFRRKYKGLMQMWKAVSSEQ